MTVTVRIAPSPTGYMHIGTAQSALFNWLFARRHGGAFLLRIEDTDTDRDKPEYEASIIDGLRWLGIDWDNTELYRQSERTALYREHLQRLLDSGHAYWREYSVEERAAMEKEGRPARDKVIALKQSEDDPEREIAFDDMIRGRIAVRAKHIGNLVLAKDLDSPLYNFAVVVDDITMGITHVIRGEDHISNTPKQFLIYESLGVPPPKFAHLPLILAPDRTKLSKRHGAVSVTEYQKDYLPDALLNFLGSLSYTFTEEMLTKEEMIAQFDLARVHPSGAVFNSKKLNWYNMQYIRRLSPSAFKALIEKPDLPDVAVPIITERLERLTDVEQFAYLWEDPVYETELLLWKSDTPDIALDALTRCATESSLTQERLDVLATEYFNGQKGSVFWPLRVALSGQRNSAGPLEISAVIGNDRVKTRIATAIEKLRQ